MLTLEDIRAAEERLRPHLPVTPVQAAPELGSHITLKLETSQPTHSFKIRGAINAILSLDETQRARGVIAASSGNHAQAISWASQHTGIQATVLMPATTPATKIERSKRWGATVQIAGDNFDETELIARRRANEEGLVYISPYNDVQVAAGQGTIGLELLTQQPDIERVIVCVGGGGLISGIGSAIKALKPNVEVIGVNAAHAPAMYNHLHHTRHPEVWNTLADALSGDIEAGSITLTIAQQVVDRMVMVSEAQIAAAMRFLYDTYQLIAEGGGAVGVAAVLHGLIPHDGRSTVIVVSGGNVAEEKIKGLQTL